MSIKNLSHTTLADNDKNPYLYNGKEFDEEFGLQWYHYGFRMYDPVLGRFPSLDPKADEFAFVSPYNYAENSSIANIDLWGLQKLPFKYRFKKAFQKLFKPRRQPVNYNSHGSMHQRANFGKGNNGDVSSPGVPRPSLNSNKTNGAAMFNTYPGRTVKLNSNGKLEIIEVGTFSLADNKTRFNTGIKDASGNDLGGKKIRLGKNGNIMDNDGNVIFKKPKNIKAYHDEILGDDERANKTGTKHKGTGKDVNVFDGKASTAKKTKTQEVIDELLKERNQKKP